MTPLMIEKVMEKARQGFSFDVQRMENPLVTLSTAFADVSGFAGTNHVHFIKFRQRFGPSECFSRLTAPVWVRIVSSNNEAGIAHIKKWFKTS